MLTDKHGKVEWEVPTKPIEMRKNCVAGGQPRKYGEVIEVTRREFTYLVNTGAAIPHLGEPVATKKKTRKKKDD